MSDLKGNDSALVNSLKYQAIQKASKQGYQNMWAISTKKKKTGSDIQNLKTAVSDLAKEFLTKEFRNFKFNKEDKILKTKCWYNSGEIAS